MLELSGNEIQNPIKPHSYPIVLKITMVMLFAGLLYFCMFFFPKYYELYSRFRLAEQNFIWGNYVEAIKGYKSVLGGIKNSKTARIRTVQAHFALNQNEKALKVLSNVELSTKDWLMLKKYMPEGFEVYFKRKTKIC
jgi:hypothetical protein